MKIVFQAVWLDEPEEHDYPAAEQYLSLLTSNSEAAEIVGKLQDQPVVRYKAKDLLRASGMLADRLDQSNHHVSKNLKKIYAKTPLSPVLLVRSRQQGLIIADGFHRVCAVYLADEDAEVPCKIF